MERWRSPIASALTRGSPSYDAIQKWAADKGIKLGAPPREHYVTDPEGEPDSAKWKTEVIWPIG